MIRKAEGKGRWNVDRAREEGDGHAVGEGEWLWDAEFGWEWRVAEGKGMEMRVTEETGVEEMWRRTNKKSTRNLDSEAKTSL